MLICFHTVIFVYGVTDSKEFKLNCQTKKKLSHKFYVEVALIRMHQEWLNSVILRHVPSCNHTLGTRH